jgi:arylsulfatase A-like enzyme
MCRLRLWLLLALAVLGLSSAHAATRPNIVFVFTDDFGWGDIGAYGGKFVPTPNLDRMAREGTRFEQFTVASPICSPSRAGFLTGMFPSRWRITSFLQSRKGNAACEQADFLDPKAPTIARLLKDAGYATGHFGKWHLGGGRDVTNAPSIREYGFDEWASTYESPEPHPDLTATNWIWSAHDKVKRWDRTAFFVDKTLDFLKRHPDQPCFVNLWPDDTHDPFVPGPELAAKHGAGKDPMAEANFKAVLEEFDRQIGRLLDGLRASGLATNTLVVLTGDNGPLPTYQQRRTGGLRGSKLSLYEGGLRLPLIAWQPGRVPAGIVNSNTVLNSLDLLPTFCQMAGAPVPADIAARLDGEDLGTAFAGTQPLRTKPLFWEYGRNDTSFRYAPAPANRSPRLAHRDGHWKLLVNPDGTGAELYDLATDRNETTNLAEKEPEIAKRMADAALKWRRALP